MKLSLKSHFKFFKKMQRNKHMKQIFVKEIYIFLMALSGFLKKEFFKVGLIFKKKKYFKVNLLKSPIRHKKFFNQVFSEIFYVNINIHYINTHSINYIEIIDTFLLLESKLGILGTNLLTKNKTVFCFLNAFSYQPIEDFKDEFDYDSSDEDCNTRELSRNHNILMIPNSFKLLGCNEENKNE